MLLPSDQRCCQQCVQNDAREALHASTRMGARTSRAWVIEDRRCTILPSPHDLRDVAPSVEHFKTILTCARTRYFCWRQQELETSRGTGSEHIRLSVLGFSEELQQLIKSSARFMYPMRYFDARDIWRCGVEDEVQHALPKTWQHPTRNTARSMEVQCCGVLVSSQSALHATSSLGATGQLVQDCSREERSLPPLHSFNPRSMHPNPTHCAASLTCFLPFLWFSRKIDALKISSSSSFIHP